jgi:hypothetical protein
MTIPGTYLEISIPNAAGKPSLRARNTHQKYDATSHALSNFIKVAIGSIRFSGDMSNISETWVLRSLFRSTVLLRQLRATVTSPTVSPSSFPSSVLASPSPLGVFVLHHHPILRMTVLVSVG